MRRNTKSAAASPSFHSRFPEIAVVPLSQHIGAPAVPCVSKGDTVRTGQVIATAAGFVSSNIHAPVSGTVVAVDQAADGGGMRKPAITIRTDGDVWIENIDRSDTLVKECHLSKQEIIEKMKEAGIVGMGGATCPSHVKLSIPAGKKAECLIINGVECEPFLTGRPQDHAGKRRGEEIVVGIEILIRALEVPRAYIGIENNKPDAIEHMERLCASRPNIEVVPLRVRYPQGGEKQLIEAVTGREVALRAASPSTRGPSSRTWEPHWPSTKPYRKTSRSSKES